MSDSICVRLPYLHAFHADGLPFRYLHPGLPDLDGPQRWLPPDYPFSRSDAHALARDLRGLRESDLEAARVLHNRRGIAAEAGWRQEMAELAALEREKAAPAVGERILREQAQKIIIWIWTQEEALLDISSLENSCAAAAVALEQTFLDKEKGISAGITTPDLSLLPPWRVCAANAALFLPPEIPILVEGGMAADMEEYMDFAWSGDWSRIGAGRSVRLVKAPLWRALGQSRPGQGADYYMAERFWLMLEDA